MYHRRHGNDRLKLSTTEVTVVLKGNERNGDRLDSHVTVLILIIRSGVMLRVLCCCDVFYETQCECGRIFTTISCSTRCPFR